MRRGFSHIAAVVLCALPLAASAADRKPMPDDAKVYIIWPADGQTIQGGKFWLRMGLSNAGIAPAGTEKQYTGHHHEIGRASCRERVYVLV